MDAHDMTVVSRKATSETEVFINCYLDDQARGWPTVSLIQAEKPNPPERQASLIQRCLSPFDELAQHQAG